MEKGTLAAVRLLALTVLSGAALAGPVPTAGSRGLERALVAELVELADWCNKKKLFATRDELYEKVLAFDDEHRDARWHLRYRRADGAWEREPDHEAPRNRTGPSGRRAIRQYRERLAAVQSELRAKAAELAAEVAEEAEREALWRTLLLAFPDDEVVREQVGERRWDLGANLCVWLSERGVRSLGRRAELRGLRDAPPVEGFEQRVAVVGSERCSGETGGREADLAAVEALLGDVAGCGTLPTGFVVHLADGQAERADYLGSLGLSGDTLASAARFGSYWLPASHKLVVSGETPKDRRDHTVLHAVSLQLRLRYGLGRDSGWAFQALCLYVTEEVLGDPSPFPVASTTLDLGGVLPTGPEFHELGARWLAEATEAQIASLLGDPSGDLDHGELAASASVFRYLIEVDPERVVPLLESVRQGVTPASLEAAVGEPPVDFARRVAEWSEELLRVEVGGAGRRADPEAKDDLERLTIELGREGEAALLAAVSELSASQARELAEACAAAALASGAPQVESVREWAARVEDGVREPTAFGAHDAREYGGGPPRREIGPGHRLWDSFERLYEAARARAAGRVADYELATGRVVATGSERDAAACIERLLRGRLPDTDLAEAAVMQALDEADDLRPEARYFAHAYTDRDGNAYEGISLFDAWSGGVDLEVPDVDALAYMVEVWGERGFKPPLDGSDHAVWYPRIASSLAELRTRKQLLRGLAAVWFAGRPPLDGGYDASIDLMHATIALHGTDTGALANRLERDGAEFLGRALREVSDLGDEAWNAGNARRDALAAGVQGIRQAVLAVLSERGLLGG